MIEILGVREGSREEVERIARRQEGAGRTGKVQRHDPYQKTKAAVYATGNKWAIENFEATH